MGVTATIKPHENFIGGKWLPTNGGGTLPVYDPSTGEVYAHITDSTPDDVHLAVVAARKAFDSGAWGRTPTASAA